MKGTRSAIRYAKSLLDLAVEKNILDAVRNDMQILDTVIAENHELELMLKSPVVKADKKIAVLKSLFGSFNELSTSFIELIAKNGRESILPAIASSFDKLYKEHKGLVDVIITSAVKLDDDTKKGILAKVQEAYQGELVVTEKINADLIGGFQVAVGDHLIDSTVSRRFRDLRQVLLN